MSKRIYIVYDERAMYDVDEASVYETADSLEEAKATDFVPSVVYSYAIGKGNILTDARFEEYINEND